MKIILDPGHGGFDPGGGSNDKWNEKDLTLKISKYQAKRLKELGIPVSLSRTDDEFLPAQARIIRVDELANGNDAILISNHINTGGSKGAEVIYAKRNEPTLGIEIANQIAKEGQNIRNVYTRTNEYGYDYYYIIREPDPNIEPLIVEYGFADNLDDQEILIDRWNDLAEAVVKALAIYLGYQYYEPNFTVYRVEKNDSLFSISKKFSTTISKIKKDNNLTSDVIYPGQELYIYE